MNKNITNKLKNQLTDTKEINKTILRQYGIIIALWAIISFILIILFAIYTHEMRNIYSIKVTVSELGLEKTVEEWRKVLPECQVVEQQYIYHAMVDAVFGNSKNVLEVGAKIPLVWFSCMLFIPNFSTCSNWQTCWDGKLTNVTTCQIYILISTILAIIGLGFYLYLVIQYSVKLNQSNKKGLTNKYPLYKNDLHLYSNTVYVNFIIAISAFFSFYALSATVIMLIYMLVIKAIYKKIEKINIEKGNNVNLFKSDDLSYFKTLFIVMAVMICYNVANSIITNRLNVDINSVLSGFFSVGGIAVIIASLVKNLLSSTITEVRKKVKNINNQINDIQFFYSIRKGEAAFDFTFAQSLPPVIKKIIHSSKDIDAKAIRESFEKLFEYTDFIKSFNFSKNKHSNAKNRNFILYRMYNEIDTFDEMEDIKINLNKELAFKK